MRKQEQPFNPEAEAVLTLIPEYQDTPFVITGLGEQLLPIAEAVQAAESAAPVKRRNVASVAVEAATQAPEAPQVLSGRRATITAKLHDLVNGTNMYDLLLQKRAEERDLAMAKKLGLITTDRCAKHDRQLATVRGML